LLVVDGTRKATLDTALALQASAEQTLGPVPFILVFNKSDLTSSWEIEDELLDQYSRRGWLVIRTSAKTGDDVENAFANLARAMLA
jgi:hypothetical protein